jgi:hypothetical protein
MVEMEQSRSSLRVDRAQVTTAPAVSAAQRGSGAESEKEALFLLYNILVSQ